MPRRKRQQADSVTEQRIIELVAKRFASIDSRVIVGIGDDAAVLKGAGGGASKHRRDRVDQVVIEGVHFDRRYLSLGDIGYKALAVNLSDIAAMGASPTFAFGCLGVPPGMLSSEVKELLNGVHAAASPAKVELAGGDTVAAPQLVVSFTVLGEVRGKALMRSGAKVGDLLWHSGDLGLSQVGLHLLCSGKYSARHPGVQAHRRPVPQLALGEFLRQSGLATACLDSSDSLAQCLLQLTDASQVGLRLELTDYSLAGPVSEFIDFRRKAPRHGPAAFSVPAAMQPDGRREVVPSSTEFLLASAEDYQLLFTAPPKATERLLAGSPVPLGRLGRVVPRRNGRRYYGEDGKLRKLVPLGYEHLPK
jgi:thiamine-monophosphate kinase